MSVPAAWFGGPPSCEEAQAYLGSTVMAFTNIFLDLPFREFSLALESTS